MSHRAAALASVSLVPFLHTACSEDLPAEPATATVSQAAIYSPNASYCTTNPSRPAPVADPAKWDALRNGIELPNGSLATTVEAARVAWGVTGLSIVIIEDYGITQERHWGYSNLSTNRQTSGNTFYHSASITKMVSGLVFAGAHRRNDIDIHESATNIVDRHPNTLLDEWRDEWFSGAEATYPDDITISRLVSHTAGLNHHGIGVQGLNNLDTFEYVLMGGLPCKTFGPCGPEEAVRPIHEPRTVFDYSGGSFAVAELMLEEETGLSFTNYAEANVLTPILGASPISKFDTASAADINLANPGSIKGSLIKSAGALLANPAEYAAIVEVVLNDGVDRDCNVVIPDDDIKMLLTPIHHEDSSKAPCSSDNDCNDSDEECVFGKCKNLIQADGLDYGLGVYLDTVRRSDGLPRSFEHGGLDGSYGLASGFRAHRGLGTGIVVFVHGPDAEDADGLKDAIVNAYRCVYEGNSSLCGGHPNGATCDWDLDCASGNCEPIDWWNSGDKKCNAVHCGLDEWDANDFNDGSCSNDCRLHNQDLCPQGMQCTDSGCVETCETDADCSGDHPNCVFADALGWLKVCGVANCGPCRYDETPDTLGCTGSFADGHLGGCSGNEACYDTTCRSPGTCSGYCIVNGCTYETEPAFDNCGPGFTAVGSCPTPCDHTTNATCNCVW
jgi:CubicO group peptidase (beta-lactamase class C family)